MSVRTADEGTRQQTDQHDAILTVAEVAAIIRCKPSSVYNLTRKRGATLGITNLVEILSNPRHGFLIPLSPYVL
jgi:hypothetical protein